MKHECAQRQRVTAALKEIYPDCENIAPPIEMFSGRMYLNFTADRTVRGKKKQVEIPVLLSHCPFCGDMYEDDEKLCIRCGKKPTNHPDSPYCQECEDRIDDGPVSRLVQAGDTKEFNDYMKSVLDPRD